MIRRQFYLVISLLVCFQAPLFATPIVATVSTDQTTYFRTVLMPDGRHIGFRGENRNGYIVAQNDIILGPVPGYDTVTNRSSGISIKANLWLDGIIPFQFSDNISSSSLRDRVQAAVAHWNQNSSIRLVERTAANAEAYKDYLEFTDSGSCASYVGRIGGRQEIWVSDSCTTGSMIHEIGHAIGLLHEHTRNDRDQHIVVNYDNITPGKEHNFAIPAANVADLGSYDYGSIMHYGAYFFSSEGNPTISPIDDITGIEMGQREALSQGDINGINSLYSTDLALSLDAPNNVDPASEFTIDATVTNLGEMGANEIMIVVPVDASHRLINFTGDGWDCEQQADRVVCGLPVLFEYAHSRVSMTLVSAFEAPEQLTANLSSRTWDSDTSNNGEALPELDTENTHNEFFEEPMTGSAHANADTAEPGTSAGALSLAWLGLLGLLVFSRKTS